MRKGFILLTSAILFAAACKPKQEFSQSQQLSVANGENQFQKVQQVAKNAGNFLKSIGPNIQWHIGEMARNNPYAKFAAVAKGGANLTDDFGYDEFEMFDPMAFDFDSVSAITVPDDGAMFALSESSHAPASPQEARKKHAGVLKGLMEYLRCNSPAEGVYAFAAIDKVPFGPGFSALPKVGLKLPGAFQGKAAALLPGLASAGRLVRFDAYGGLTLHGPNAGFAAMIEGPRVLSMSYLEGVEGSLHGGVQHQRKVLGLPAFYSMQAGATWNDKEFSLLLYQGMPFGALGAMISFSYEKIAKLGDIEAWKKGGVSCKSAHH